MLLAPGVYPLATTLTISGDVHIFGRGATLCGPPSNGLSTSAAVRSTAARATLDRVEIHGFMCVDVEAGGLRLQRSAAFAEMYGLFVRAGSRPAVVGNRVRSKEYGFRVAEGEAVRGFKDNVISSYGFLDMY